MSVEQAKAFIEKLSTDNDFYQKIMAIETKDGRIKKIRQEGFDCTAEEIDTLEMEEQEDWEVKYYTLQDIYGIYKNFD